MLYNIIILPIEMIVEWVFNFIRNFPQRPPVMYAIVGVSIVINMLALPLYNVAEKIQNKERHKVKVLSYWVNHIKKSFKGDERFMMLSQYYRENNYHPLYALRSSLSILIEIPFFIAAYHFLSRAESLQGSSWWIFKDLGSPDALFQIGTFKINTLPIIMTLINFISGFVYTKGFPLKDKIQLYGVGLLFLVLLYNSPSGLVLYWICNNIFSLLKNIVNKFKCPIYILYILLLVGLIYFNYAMTKYSMGMGFSFKRLLLLVFTILFFLFPFIKFIFKKQFIKMSSFMECVKCRNGRKGLFIVILCGLGVVIFNGLVLPSQIIASSPIEFCTVGSVTNPIHYIWNNFQVWFGFGLFWPLCIYLMFGKYVKFTLPCLSFIVFVSSVMNAYILRSDYGQLNAFFTIENTFALNQVGMKEALLSMSIFMGALSLFYVALKLKLHKSFALILLSLCIGEMGFSSVKVYDITKEAKVFLNNKNLYRKEDISSEFHLSKYGKNVLILYLDRAINGYVPHIMKMYPHTREQYKGFVYYPNTLSFGSGTMLGFPPVAGGYEYTPYEMDCRKNELLKDKHNEATLVMPRLFSEAGWESTITDMPFPNYKWKGDLSAFKDYSNVRAFEISGKYKSNYVNDMKTQEEDSSKKCLKELTNFTVLQTLAPNLRWTFNVFCRDASQSDGFLNEYGTLYSLDRIVSIDSYKNTFNFICNSTTHNGCYWNEDKHVITSKGKTPCGDYQISSEIDETHFSINTAALCALGKFFDYLRDNNVYDNTRIIIVSDHGFSVSGIEGFGDLSTVKACYNPLLMVKDFNCNGELTTSNEFMTNADTLFIAKAGLDISNTNPFTGKDFVQNKREGITIYNGYTTQGRNDEKYTFGCNDKSGWLINNNIFDTKNWISLGE